MKKINIFAICLLFLLGCESEEKIDVSKPLDLDKAVALFCQVASKELPKGSHVIVRKKDFESVNEASKEYVHWKVSQNFTDRKAIEVHDNDDVTAQDLKDKGEIFIIKVSLKKWLDRYKVFFSMYKNDVKANDKSVLKKEYDIRVDSNLNSLLELQTEEESNLVEETQIEESGKGFLRVINQDKNRDITGIRILKKDAYLLDSTVSISYEDYLERELRTGEYKLQIRDDIGNKYCSIGSFKITNENTVTKTYKGNCK